MKKEEIMLFQEATSDIKEIKALEWRITYYVLILTGAILSISTKIIAINSIAIKISIITIIVIVNSAGIYLIDDCAKTLRNYRERLSFLGGKLPLVYTTNNFFINGYIKISEKRIYHFVFKASFVLSAIYSFIIIFFN
jgi:hypothetical protein